RLPAASAVATTNAPGEPGHVLRLLEPARPEVEARGCAMVNIGGSSFPITKALLDELEATRMEVTIRELGRPLLILHAPRDTSVGIDNAARIFQAARHPKSFLSLDDADHLLSGEADGDYAAGLIAAWAGRYLPAAPAQTPAESEEPAAAGVVVRIGPRGYTSTVRAGRHELIADEPASLGGADLGPTPYDYLLAGLGACTTITLRMYADRKGWPLEAATVRLRHSRVHAADCADCETKEGRLDQIERDLELAGPLDAEQRARLVEIADRCPVHRTLHGEIKVRTRVVEAESEAPPPAE
ncbi:MAG TPA: bifunctional alpha/beta hydrolase/OsmC family protein, partial [Chloroflexaceae bacterium]|nr:bifunctional alpha/beta hydrolase/OsmC family protein [Chloroflexaceae bacterium]